MEKELLESIWSEGKMSIHLEEQIRGAGESWGEARIHKYTKEVVNAQVYP